MDALRQGRWLGSQCVFTAPGPPTQCTTRKEGARKGVEKGCVRNGNIFRIYIQLTSLLGRLLFHQFLAPHVGRLALAELRFATALWTNGDVARGSSQCSARVRALNAVTFAWEGEGGQLAYDGVSESMLRGWG